MIENIYHSNTLLFLMLNVNTSKRGYSERLGTPKIWRNTGDSSRLNFNIFLIRC